MGIRSSALVVFVGCCRLRYGLVTIILLESLIGYTLQRNSDLSFWYGNLHYDNI